MRTQADCDYSSMPFEGCLANRLERLQLRFQVQSIAGFCFDSGRALAGHLVERGKNLASEFSLGSFPHRMHAGANAAPAIPDCLVACTCYSPFEITQAGSEKSRMRMGIDKAGHHDMVGAVEFCNLFSVFLKPGVAQGAFSRTYGDNFPAGAQDRAFFNHAESSQFRPTARPGGGGSQRKSLADGGQE